jgi:hypothetical protein
MKANEVSRFLDLGRSDDDRPILLRSGTARRFVLQEGGQGGAIENGLW